MSAGSSWMQWIRQITLGAVFTVVAVTCHEQSPGAEPTAVAADASPEELLRASGIAGGLVVCVGSGPAAEFAEFATALRLDKRFVVHSIYTGPDEIADVRRAIARHGDYGQVTAESLSAAAMPLADRLVNLLVVSDPGKVPSGELERVVAPGGVILLRGRERYERIVKPQPDSMDQWTHLLYEPGNNAVSNDEEVGPPYHLRWIAPPLNARHHESLGTVSVVVSAAGRLFYIIDEAPAASILLPARWAVVARDAFSGVVLWKRRIPRWEDHLRPFRNGPPELSRTLVATDDRVYVTLGLRAAVSALDPATGKTVKQYKGTEGSEEILYRDGVLYLATRRSDDKTSGQRGLMAVDARTGRILWQQPGADPLPMTLAMADRRLVFMTSKGVVCLEAATGKAIWHTARDVPEKRPGWSAPTVVVHEDVVLVADRQPEYPGTLDEVTGKPIATWLAQEGWAGDLIAYSAETGAELWKCRCAEAYHSPPDVFVADGLVWVGQSRSRTGPDFVAGYDLHTGEIKRRLDTTKAWDTTMPHHRCHRNRATQQYIIASRTGVEFIDLETGDARRHHWTRGTCQFGVLPCNGLLYVPPHSCACYIDGKLTGFMALAPRAELNQNTATPVTSSPRLQRGPAFEDPISRSQSTDSAEGASAEWPTYRADASRRAYLPQVLPAELGEHWQSEFGTRISSPVIAEGKVFVAAIDAHTVHALDAASGETAWTFTAGGRIDSPPTVAAGRVAFGAADGYVYCLRGRDGTLAWRFRAAPSEQRIMAFGQLESAWPVHGSVLVSDGSIYCAAGRSSFLDGGMVLYRLDLRTGEVLAERTIYSRDPVTGEQPPEPDSFEMAGALPDVLATDGRLVYMRHLAFDARTLEPREAKKHVYSPAGFLNGDWWHRTYWIDGTHFYSGYIGWYFAGREAPAGRLLTFTENKLYGFGYAPTYYRGSRGRQYRLFALDRASQPEQPEADYRRANRDYPARGPGQFRISYDWSQDVPLVVRAMVLGQEKLVIAGAPPEALTSPREFAGAEGGRLAIVSTADGRLLKQYRLDGLAAYDGLAAAGDRLFLSLEDGRLLCLGSGGQLNRSLSPIKPLAERLPPLDVVEQPGLAGYWKLDEGEGPMARDSSGGRHTGTVKGRWAAGSFGTCLRTDGIPGALTIPDGPVLHRGTGDFTVALWLKLENHDCRVLGKEDFPRNWWVVNVRPDGRAELVLGAGKGPGQQVRTNSTTPIPLNTWTHLCYVVDRQNSAVRCYLDGKPAGTQPIPASLADATFDVKGVDLRIPPSFKPFRGLFDDLKFYCRALGSEEIQANWDAESAVVGR